jgi:copper chaperone NosL
MTSRDHGRASIRMQRVPRILVAVAALLLGVMFMAPLWSIRLIAPQYPEGLGLVIRLNTIVGIKENDLNSINSLNHYIGMRPILPEAIPELRYMPWIVGALIAGGLLVALVGRRRLLVTWVVALAAAGVAGMYDFWRWGYDYGHNLDVEQAIITVPGMTYQPPLIGTKQLLNFQATSLPHIGAAAAGVAFMLALAALVVAYRARVARVPAASAVLAATMACGVPGHAIAFGLDRCAECRMLVSDKRFGAQIVLDTGKEITFDSIECMYAYLAHVRSPSERWVVTANHAGTLVREGDAEFRDDGALHPPMGKTYALAR